MAPQFFSLENSDILAPVQYQGKCKCCYAFAAAGCVSAYYATRKNQLFQLSIQHIIDDMIYDDPRARTDKHGCKTGHHDQVFNFIKDHGVHLEPDYEYEAMRYRNASKLKEENLASVPLQIKIGSYSMVTHFIRNAKIAKHNSNILKQYPLMRIKGYKRVDKLKKLGWTDEHTNLFIISGRPLAGSIEVGKEFENLEAGTIYEGGETGKIYTHMVMIIGFGDNGSGKDFLRIQNSWGTQWCDKGFGNVRRDLIFSISFPCTPILKKPKGFCIENYGKELELREWKQRLSEYRKARLNGVDSNSISPPTPPTKSKKKNKKLKRALLEDEEDYVNPVETRKKKRTLYVSTRGSTSGSDENDIVVIGRGPGGYVAANKKTTCIEKRDALGGACLNVRCIPSKALLHSSHMHEAKHSFANHGVKVSNVETDVAAMLAQKDKAVSNLTRGIEGLFKKNKVNYAKGYGKFISPSEISVDSVDGGNTVVKGKNIIVATGSDVKSLPGITIDEKRIVSSTGALSLTEVPKRLVVIGAGYIGLEMGSVWGRLGSEVTVVEFAPDIVPTMDAEVRKQFQCTLEKQKMKFKLKTKVVSVDSSGDTVKLTLEPADGGEQFILEADVVLVSAGRIPFTAGLGLDKNGVETDRAGRILVNERFASNVSGVFAIGDVIPGPMLAHKAEEDGVACVEYIAGKEGHVDYDLVPGVCYTHPEVAYVGKTEEQVKALGVEYRVGKFPFMANSRAKAIDDAEGIVKIIAEKETDKILGVHIMSPNAGELIHEAVLALQYGASSEDIARTCHAHPTMSEAVKEAAMATYDKAIHI